MEELPKEYPKWTTVYAYFAKWRERPGKDQPSLLEQVLKKQVGEVRRKSGRKEKTTHLIIDAQSVKNTDPAGQKGYDAGKKVSGIKRHMAVDKQGLPHAVAVTTAEVTDRKVALVALGFDPEHLSEVRALLTDSAYTGKPFSLAVEDLLGASVQIAKRSELHAFAVIPKRWVVGTPLRLARSMPPSLEKLRTPPEHLPPVRLSPSSSFLLRDNKTGC